MSWNIIDLTFQTLANLFVILSIDITQAKERVELNANKVFVRDVQNQQIFSLTRKIKRISECIIFECCMLTKVGKDRVKKCKQSD